MYDSKNKNDRRPNPRFEIPVQLRPTEFFGREGRIQNINVGGVRIFGTKNITVGTTLKIEFALPVGDWILAGVQVVWVKERSSESILKYDIGCRFTEVSPDSQLILLEYLAKILHE